MHLSFIGMSGIGKSHWSSQLVTEGFKRFCCDDLIAQKLKPELTKADGSEISMGEWMGFPYEPQYQTCQQQYLRYEIEVLNQILTCLESNDHSSENIVIDTTGSVIYTGQKLLQRLAQQTQIIYLDTPLEVQEHLQAAYQADPRPLVWMNQFNKQPHETNQTAMIRCYPNLLTSRVKHYRAWANIILDYYMLRQEDFFIESFLDKICDTCDLG